MTWRVGRRVPRNLYLDDIDVGRLDTPELAALVAAGMNERDALREDAAAARNREVSLVEVANRLEAESARLRELLRDVQYEHSRALIGLSIPLEASIIGAIGRHPRDGDG